MRMRAFDFAAARRSAADTTNAANACVLPLPKGPCTSRTGWTVRAETGEAVPASVAATNARATASAWSSLSPCRSRSAAASATRAFSLGDSSTRGAPRTCGNSGKDASVALAKLSNSANEVCALNALTAYARNLSPRMPCAGRGVSRCTSSLPSLSGPCHRLCTTTVQGARARSPTSPRGGGTNPGTLLITQRSPLPYSFEPRRSFASLRCSQVLFVGPFAGTSSSSSSSSSASPFSPSPHLPLAPRRAFQPPAFFFCRVGNARNDSKRSVQSA